MYVCVRVCVHTSGEHAGIQARDRHREGWVGRCYHGYLGGRHRVIGPGLGGYTASCPHI